MLPLVTVIVPVYNGAAFLEETLKSAVGQTYANREIIVVDDGSIDHSADIVDRFDEILYLYQKNQGVSVARNAGIEKSKGEFIAFLDADDIWKPDKLSIQVNYMLRHPERRISATKAENFLEPGTQLPSWIKGQSNWKDVHYAIPSTMVIHKSVFSETGDFSADYRSSEDTEWLWRIHEAKISVFYIDEILTLRRFHGSNLSWKNGGDDQSQLLRIIRESITRKAQSTR